MNTINARIKVNEYQDCPAIGITPTEAMILRFMHAPADHKLAATAANPDEAARYWNCLINPKPAGVASVQIPDEEDPDKFTTRERTNAEEVARLRRTYQVRAKSGAHGSHILDDLYPGMNPDLPQTFEQIGMKILKPVETNAKPPKSKDAKAN